MNAPGAMNAPPGMGEVWLSDGLQLSLGLCSLDSLWAITIRNCSRVHLPDKCVVIARVPYAPVAAFA